MAWLAALAFAKDFIGGAISGNAERDAANDANDAAKKQAKDIYQQDLKVWEINNLKAMYNYSLDVATVAAPRYQERVREQDYHAKNAGNIEPAVQIPQQHR